MTIETFLNRLHKVKKRGPGQWMALCPVHGEKTPSLSIKDDNGTILIHCFGCGAGGVDICGAVGVEPSELFPPSDNFDASERRPKRQNGFEPDQVLFAVVMEVIAVQLIAEDMAKNCLDEATKLRLDMAAKRIHGAWMYAKKYGS